MARIRVPGGALSTTTLAALADWADELGNGQLELTGRGNIQLRGLRAGAEWELSARLAERGMLPSIAHERARNVLASPLSGRDGVGVLDVRGLVSELDHRLCGIPELAELSGRFLFALDDGRGDVAGLRPDAAALALPERRFALLIGGWDSGVRLPVADTVTGLLAVARAFLRQRADERVWRVAELPGGPLALVDAVTEELNQGPAPVGRVETGPEVRVPEPSRFGPVGRIEQRDGRVALAVSVPLGALSPARCRLLAAVAAREVLLTPWRGVVLPDLSPSDIELAARRLAGAGLLLDPSAPGVGVSACTGRPGCARALADVRADAAVEAMGDAIPTAGPAVGAAVPLAIEPRPRLPVHWSGCARGCGRPPGPVVDVVAQEGGGYRVIVGGEQHYVGADVNAVRAAVADARMYR